MLVGEILVFDHVIGDEFLHQGTQNEHSSARGQFTAKHMKPLNIRNTVVNARFSRALKSLNGGVHLSNFLYVP